MQGSGSEGGAVLYNSWLLGVDLGGEREGVGRGERMGGGEEGRGRGPMEGCDVT